MLVELDIESVRSLLVYWKRERNYARDCRWTQQKYLKEQPEYADFWVPRVEEHDKRYRECDIMVKKYRTYQKLL